MRNLQGERPGHGVCECVNADNHLVEIQRTCHFSQFHSQKTFTHQVQMCCVPTMCKIQHVEVPKKMENNEMGREDVSQVLVLQCSQKNIQ